MQESSVTVCKQGVQSWLLLSGLTSIGRAERGSDITDNKTVNQRIKKLFSDCF